MRNYAYIFLITFFPIFSFANSEDPKEVNIQFSVLMWDHANIFASENGNVQSESRKWSYLQGKEFLPLVYDVGHLSKEKQNYKGLPQLSLYCDSDSGEKQLLSQCLIQQDWKNVCIIIFPNFKLEGTNLYRSLAVDTSLDHIQKGQVQFINLSSKNLAIHAFDTVKEITPFSLSTLDSGNQKKPTLLIKVAQLNKKKKWKVVYSSMKVIVPSERYLSLIYPGNNGKSWRVRFLKGFE